MWSYFAGSAPRAGIAIIVSGALATLLASDRARWPQALGGAGIPWWVSGAVIEDVRLCAEGKPPANRDASVRALGEPAAWFTSDDYPTASMRAKEQGVAVMRYDIDRYGRIAACRIVSSSGHSRLDARTCEVMSARARFTPARDARGCPAPWSGMRRVRWQLPFD